MGSAETDGGIFIDPYGSAAVSAWSYTVAIAQTYSTIGANHKRDLDEALRALGVSRKRARTAVLELTPRVAGYIMLAHRHLDTEIVAPSDRVRVKVPPTAVSSLVSEVAALSVTPYTVNDRPATHFEWASREDARVEHYEDFVLIAWTSRLKPGDALKFLRRMSEPESDFLVTTLSGTVTNPDDVHVRRLLSRPEQLRLIRVENKDSTYIWEMRSNLSSPPRRAQPRKGGFLRGDDSEPEFVVMTAAPEPSYLRETMELTATVRVMHGADEVLKAV